jgi:hypothetical protein
MGVTTYFEGQLKDEAAYQRFDELVSSFAKAESCRTGERSRLNRTKFKATLG